jgi:hypothetical protein
MQSKTARLRARRFSFMSHNARFGNNLKRPDVAVAQRPLQAGLLLRLGLSNRNRLLLTSAAALGVLPMPPDDLFAIGENVTPARLFWHSSHFSKPINAQRSPDFRNRGRLA